MHEQDAAQCIGVYPGKATSLALAQEKDPHQKRRIEQQEGHGPDETALLGPLAKDEVGLLLWHKTVARHGPLSPAFSCQSAGPNGGLGMPDVVIGVGIAHIEAKQHVDPLLLVWLEHIFQGHMQGKGIHQCRQADHARYPHRSGPITGQGGTAQNGGDRRADQHQNDRECAVARARSQNRNVHFCRPGQDGQNGQHDRGKPCDEHCARHAFPVQGKNEADKHQHCSGIGLEQNEPGWNPDDGQGAQSARPILPPVTGAEVPSQGHGGPQLGEFRRLDAKAPNAEPRPGSAHLFADHKHGRTKADLHGIVQPSCSDEEFTLHLQNQSAQQQTDAKPQGLFSVKGAQRPVHLAL